MDPGLAVGPPAVDQLRLGRGDGQIGHAADDRPVGPAQRPGPVGHVVDVGAARARVGLGEGHGDGVAAVAGVLDVGPLARVQDQRPGRAPAGAVAGGRERRVEVAATPEQVDAVALGRQLHRVGVGVAVGARGVGGEDPLRLPGGDVLGPGRAPVPHVVAGMGRPEHQQPAVRADQDRRVDVVVHLEAGLEGGDRPQAGVVVVAGHLDAAVGRHPAGVGAAVGALEVDAARVAEPGPGAARGQLALADRLGGRRARRQGDQGGQGQRDQPEPERRLAHGKSPPLRRLP